MSYTKGAKNILTLIESIVFIVLVEIAGSICRVCNSESWQCDFVGQQPYGSKHNSSACLQQWHLFLVIYVVCSSL